MALNAGIITDEPIVVSRIMAIKAGGRVMKNTANSAKRPPTPATIRKGFLGRPSIRFDQKIKITTIRIASGLGGFKAETSSKFLFHKSPRLVTSW